MVFTHEQFIRAVIAQVLYGRGAVCPEDMARFYALRVAMPIPNGGIVKFEFRVGEWWVGSIGWSHLLSCDQPAANTALPGQHVQ